MCWPLEDGGKAQDEAEDGEKPQSKRGISRAHHGQAICHLTRNRVFSPP